MTSEGETVAGRYRITRRLGRGGMAEVWEADDRILRRRVAVKLFHVTGDDADARRSASEMHTLAGLTHPNLVTVHDAGTDHGGAFLVMELVDGPTLADRIGGPDGLDTTAAAAIGGDVAAGLAYIHRRGIVHRDVKPANILLPVRDHEDGPVAKLVDFGIAQSAGQERLTRTGMTVGTAKYLAPEQVTGRPVGPAADVYALGLVLLEALGRTPGWQGTPIEIAMARLTEPPVVPADLGPHWTSLLRAMTATDPASRPAAAQLRQALAALAADGGGPATAFGPPREERAPEPTVVLHATAMPTRGPRRRVLVGSGALVAAVLAATAITLATHRPDVAAPVGNGTASSAGGGSGSVARSGSTAPGTGPTVPTPGSGATPVAASPTPTAVAPTPGRPGHTPPGQTRTRGKPGG